jgi:hypothetical protein
MKLSHSVGCMLIAFLFSSCTAVPVSTGGSNEPGQMLMPVNHINRYAPNIFVEDAWAGNVRAHGGGGKATCCIAGRKDWSKPALVRWRWGDEEEPLSKQVILPGEDRSALVPFPRAPRRVHKSVQETWSREDYLADEAYLCVIFRALDKVEFAFSSTANDCSYK